jgi:Fic family protein
VSTFKVIRTFQVIRGSTYNLSMDLAAFDGSPAGIPVPISGVDGRMNESYESRAFVPHPLPTALPDVSIETWIAHGEALEALGRLNQACLQLPNPRLLRRPLLRREAQSTSALEGTYATIPELMEAELGEDSKRAPNTREVLNYDRAAEIGFEWIVERPLTLSFLGSLQGELVKNTPGELSDAGGLRDRQVLIGPRGGSVDEARFVPAPPGDVLRSGMEEWLRWVNDAPTAIPGLFRTAMAHYQFETLHPFSDGNGRIGRLVIVLQMLRDGILNEPLLVVSPWFENRRTEYQDHLLAVSASGRFDPWINFFLRGIRAQAIDTTQRISRLLGYQDALRTVLRSKKITGVAAQIAEDIIASPVTTPTLAARKYGVSYQTANAALKRLVREEIVTEMTGGTYGRAFGSLGVMGIIES